LSSKFPTIQSESYYAVSERYACVGTCRVDHLKFAEVPHDDFAGAIFTFREGSFE